MKKLLMVMTFGSFSVITAGQPGVNTWQQPQYQQSQSPQSQYPQSQYPQSQYQQPSQYQQQSQYPQQSQYQQHPSYQQQPNDSYQRAQSFQQAPSSPNYYQPNSSENRPYEVQPNSSEGKSSNYYQPSGSETRNAPNYYEPSSSSKKVDPASKSQSPGQLAELKVDVRSTNDGSVKELATGVSASDQEVSKKVHEILYGYIAKGDQSIGFEFEEGILTLTGYVNSQEEKDKIEQDVKKIKGVKQVNNKISIIDAKKFAYYQPKATDAYYRPVADNSSATKATQKSLKDYAALDNDKKINAKIREKLDNKGFAGVAIITANGVVTLAGTVDRSGELEPFIIEIEKIEGVKKVHNKVAPSK